MSRFTAESDRYLMAYGADHILGSFVQVFDKQLDPDDQLVVDISNLGVELSSSESFNENQKRVLDEIVNAFEAARKQGNQYPNIDAQRIHIVAVSFGIDVPLIEIYKALD